ncbi:polysaccharide deacetylase family protein [Geomicrobium sp. JCM 19039]|uniref:polysaccharide deacetylase family protein n=1 Tax=Geomicrobium sp. JCM 19039 TaxID=1460636 RepID=UPI00045F2D96|nr:polysaccharide deacetylase family protein [Geomicrobium sp. JCM 19039]GAK13258.1 hypothetical protein JCM19039_3091 [Geomicrobium sp. JCM 19039]
MSGNICLTFDFDAISLWLQKDMTSMSSISRGEFGAEAVPRFLHTLKKRNLKSTWFIPGHTMETYPKICLDIHDDGHEIGYMVMIMRILICLTSRKNLIS